MKKDKLFEDVYLRLSYFKDVDISDIPESTFLEYENIIKITSNIMYSKHKMTFEKIGFDIEDIRSISSIYALAYIKKYSIKHNEESRAKYIEGFKKSKKREPTNEEIIKKDKSNMVNFIRQKLGDCATFCRRRIKNVIAGKSKMGFFIKESIGMEGNKEQIFMEPEKYGYKKATTEEIQAIGYKEKSRIMRNKSGIIDNKEYIYIEIFNNGIDRKDYINLLKRSDSYMVKTPEEILIDSENENEFHLMKYKFNKMSKTNKIEMLTKFIEKNKDNQIFKEELKIAEKLLKKFKKQDTIRL